MSVLFVSFSQTYTKDMPSVRQSEVTSCVDFHGRIAVSKPDSKRKELILTLQNCFYKKADI